MEGYKIEILFDFVKKINKIESNINDLSNRIDAANEAINFGKKNQIIEKMKVASDSMFCSDLDLQIVRTCKETIELFEWYHSVMHRNACSAYISLLNKFHQENGKEVDNER